MDDGTIFRGFNIEFIDHNHCVHAEFSVLLNVILAGRNPKTTKAVSIQTKDGSPCCGGCRQVLVDCLDPDTPVYFGSISEDGWPGGQYLLSELLPVPFKRTIIPGYWEKFRDICSKEGWNPVI